MAALHGDKPEDKNQSGRHQKLLDQDNCDRRNPQHGRRENSRSDHATSFTVATADKLRRTANGYRGYDIAQAGLTGVSRQPATRTVPANPAPGEAMLHRNTSAVY